MLLFSENCFQKFVGLIFCHIMGDLFVKSSPFSSIWFDATIREIMIPLPKNIFSEGDVYTCTWSTKTTQTSDKPVVMKLGSVRYLEITTNHDVQSPFLHSWECELGMGAAAHCCSNLEIRAGEDWHFLLCYVSSHVFSINQKQNRVISLIFAQIKPSLVSLTSSIAKL